MGHRRNFRGDERANFRGRFWWGLQFLPLGGGYAPDFTVLGSKVLFEGVDTNDHPGLWVTDGTAAGTSQVPVAGASSSGLQPRDFTVLGNKAVFAGVDNAGILRVWATDGTAAGTSEIQVLGFNMPSHPSFTILGNKAVFAGFNSNLWVTDGTPAGTVQLNLSGLFGAVRYPALIAYGGKVLFAGSDLSGRYDLWVTDGTSTGTSKLTVAGAHPMGLFYNNNALFSVTGQNDPDFTIFGNRVLCEGEDASNNFNVWSTDGTSAGTSELVVAGANSHGLLSNGSFWISPDLTVFGNRVLFAGVDANGHINPWITDGTAAGTRELVVNGADPSGLFYNNASSSLSPEFTLIGDKVLFKGYDVQGNVNLWVTDGTAAGTSEVLAAGAASGGLMPTDLVVLGPPPSSDFNADGKSDFLWLNTRGKAYVTTVIARWQPRESRAKLASARHRRFQRRRPC
jgi:ELWxxDGT repeat protein